MPKKTIDTWINAVPGATLTKSIPAYYGRHIIGFANYYSDGTVKYFGAVPIKRIR